MANNPGIEQEQERLRITYTLILNRWSPRSM